MSGARRAPWQEPSDGDTGDALRRLAITIPSNVVMSCQRIEQSDQRHALGPIRQRCRRRRQLPRYRLLAVRAAKEQDGEKHRCIRRRHAIVRRWYADPFGFLPPWNEVPALIESAPPATLPFDRRGRGHLPDAVASAGLPEIAARVRVVRWRKTLASRPQRGKLPETLRAGRQR
jgi:hypothetical protein